MAMSVLKFISRYQVKVTCKPPWCIETGLARFNLKHQLLMNLFGHSEMGDTRTVSSMRCVVSKNVTGCYGDTTTENSRMHKEDDCHFGAWNTCVKGEMDWTPFHSTEGVWSWPVPCDPTHPDDQTQVDIEVVAYFELNIKTSSAGNSKQCWGSSKDRTDGWRQCQKIGRDWSKKKGSCHLAESCLLCINWWGKWWRKFKCSLSSSSSGWSEKGWIQCRNGRDWLSFSKRRSKGLSQWVTKLTWLAEVCKGSVGLQATPAEVQSRPISKLTWRWMERWSGEMRRWAWAGRKN